MGVVDTIDYESYPRQSDKVGLRTKVCFKYDTTHKIGGYVVRDDLEDPYRTIIKLDDGRYVLTTECQYTPPEGEA
jgi:hypothetical protein